MRSRIIKFLYLISAMLLCIGLFSTSAQADADSYTASTMRLLHYEGEVEILNAEGEPRFVLENVRFDSGETMTTGKESTASVELEEDRIVTLDSETTVEFIQEGDSMTMNLKEGTILLDVKNKLDKNQTLDIQTSNMTVGIRGTAVYLTSIPAGDTRLNEQSESTLAKILPLLEGGSDAQTSADGSVTVFGVANGNADITWTDSDGAKKTMNIQEGSKAILIGAAGEENYAGPVVAPVENDDVNAFLQENMTEERSNGLQQILQNRGNSSSDPYAPDGTWSYCGKVILIAQSASKMYDGTPLTERDILVSGLPEGFSITAQTSGSQLNAGTCENPVSDYHIYNYKDEEVTDHFTNVELVDGQLVVDPVPATIYTGSAERVYNGAALTNNEAKITTAVTSQEVETGQNISYINTQPFGEIPGAGSALQGNEDLAGQDMQVLYGLIGQTKVHGTNPITGETQEIVLLAGERLTVSLKEAGTGGDTIEYLVEKMKEEEIPEEILRMYADNPELLANVCEETGWDPEKMQELIDLLPEVEEKLVEENGIKVRANDAGSTLQNYTNVWIDVDTDITDYSGRSLGSSEASFKPITVDPSIKVTATGRQTQVGQSANTYEIEWGDAIEGNYVLSEELGSLTVTKASVTVTTGSAEKVYDGEALTNAEASITGLVAGETATVTATGSQTEAGTSDNSYTINWISANANNYTVTENLGKLTVLPKTEIIITTGSAEKVYDGTPLTSGEITVTGFPEGEAPEIKLTGTITNAGTAENTYEINWGDLDPSRYTITENLGTLTVTKASVSVITGSASKEYDGKALTYEEVFMEGLAEGESVAITTTGTITDAGTAENTYTINWGDVSSDNYTVTEELGTLTVTKAEVTVTTGSASKTFDGTALTNEEASYYGMAEDESVTITATGTQTDAGTSDNTYAITWDNAKESNYTITENLGTLTVSQLNVTFDLYCYTATYYGGKWIPEDIRGIYADGSEVERQPTADEEVAESISRTFYLIGGGVATLTCEGVIDADTYTMIPDVAFTAGSAGNYNFIYTGNIMTIQPLNVTIVLDGNYTEYWPIEYDGQFHGAFLDVYDEYEIIRFEPTYVSDNQWIVTSNVGDEIYVTVSGGGTDPGSYTLSCTSYSCSSNYTINITGTTLYITKATVTITIGTATKEYDGTPLTDIGDITWSPLPAGYNMAFLSGFVKEGSQTDVGSSPIEYDPNGYGILDENGMSAMDKFNVVIDAGYRTVTQCVLVVDLHGFTNTFYGEQTYIPDAITVKYETTGVEIANTDEGIYTYIQRVGKFVLLDGTVLTVTCPNVRATEPGTYSFTHYEEYANGDGNNYKTKYVNAEFILNN